MPKKPTPRLCSQRFEPDPVIPADHRGLLVCVHCNRLGQAGDVRHPETTPTPTRRAAPSRVAAYAIHDAAVLGERIEP